MNCRHCGTKLDYTFIDLGRSPPSNAYLAKIDEPENQYPLKVLVCGVCWLVQTEDFVGAGEMFSEDYAYFSSYSSSWLAHARDYVEKMVSRFDLDSGSNVVEIAANDGYLLQYVQERKIPCYGIEPTRSTAQAARDKGVEIVEAFFGVGLANQLKASGRCADLVVSNNVLAHVPDINDFVRGVSILLNPGGVATFEFPHIMNLVEQNQFDTIYHEHYSYLSITAVLAIFRANGLRVIDVEELPTHGGSLRVYANHMDSGSGIIGAAVAALKEREEQAGINTFDYYSGLQSSAEQIKTELLAFLADTKQRGKKVAAYGAAAKGNTLFNYAGVHADLIAYVADRNAAKQGKYMPGSRIPIVGEAELRRNQPQYVVILPWNLKSEVIQQLEYIQDWGGQFVTAIPRLELL